MVELSAGAELIVGRARQSVIGEPMTIMIPPEHRAASVAGLQRVVAGGAPRILDRQRLVEIIRGDGERISVEMTISRTSGDPPRFTAWLTAVEPEEGLTEEDPAALAERATGTGQWDLDLRSGALTWSPNVYRLLGYEPGEIEPSIELLRERVHPDDRTKFSDYLAALRRPEAPEVLDYRLIRADGEVRHIRSTVTTTDSREGEPVRLVGFGQDITDWRRSEGEAQAQRAVVDALHGWESLARSGPGLLAGIAEPLGAAAASIWLPRDGILTATTAWRSSAVESTAYEEGTLGAQVPLGTGLVGQALALCEPVELGSAIAIELSRSAVVAELDFRGGIAFPAVDGDVTLIIELLGRERIALSSNLVLTLNSIGHSIGRFMAHHRGEFEKHGLTPRELEVLQCAARGFSGPAIASQLNISAATVKGHFENLYLKLGVTDRAAAVAAGFRLGLID